MGLIKRLPESVVNRIAAGEVVVRPVNAVKELIENSIDAGANQIIVTIKQGGLKLLQVQDNGKGISKDDLDIVCERFTTSKLEKFEDLQNMQTHGFRGEALASISHVANLSITSKPASQQCAYHAKYSDSKSLDVKASAGLDGTTISAEDLFHNCASRLRVFKNHSEEANKISEVITKYSIHRPDISFALRRGGSGSDFRTKGDDQRAEVVSSLLGRQCVQDLIDLKWESPTLCYSVTGLLSKPLSTATSQRIQMKTNKQKHFILFINDRLVQCVQLKHAIDALLSEKDLMSSFVYISLRIAPSRIDVNVHPTKNSVLFLEELSIVEEIRKNVGNLLNLDEELQPRSLLNMNSQQPSQLFVESVSRASSSSSLLGDNEKVSRNNGVKNKRVDHEVVRVDALSQRIDRFFASGDESVLPAGADNVELVNVSMSQGEDYVVQKEPDVSLRLFNFESLNELRRGICREASQPLRELFKLLYLVGFVDCSSALIQYSSELYLLNISTILYDMFYQKVLFSFGNLSCYQLDNGGASVRDLLILAGETNSDMKMDEETINLSCDFLNSHKQMLHDYFSLSFEECGQIGEVLTGNELYLTTLPILVPGFVPQLEKLPLFMYSLLRHVDWDTEKLCFHGISHEIANLHILNDKYFVGCSYSGMQEYSQSWKQIYSSVLIPAARKRLIPQETYRNDAVKRLATAHDLYKVFERC